MEIAIADSGRGIKAEAKGKNYFLAYPPKVWQAYPPESKQVLIDNLAHLLTMNMPLVARMNWLKYNTGVPYFKSLFRELVIRSIPHATDDYKESTGLVLNRFDNIKYSFSGSGLSLPEYTPLLKEKAVVPLSMGKDSLLSTAVCREIGLEPSAVYINDTVSGPENTLKLRLTKKLCKEQKIPLMQITNQLERLNDFELWGRSETCIGYTHMITGFAFISLPLLHYFKSRYLVIGNQQDMNFTYFNKDGYLTHPSYDQTSQWTMELSSALGSLTKGKARVMSVIEPLTNIAAMKVLFHRYPEFAKYEVSCDSLYASDEPRWCHACSKCARLSLFIRAAGKNPPHAGFHTTLLEKKHMKLYSLFNGKEIDCYEKSKEARDQQLLAFHMLHKQGSQAPLVEEFRKRFLKEAKDREEELYRKFFSIHDSITMPSHIKKKAESVYREELG